jgi:hypothetical protein
MKKIFKKNALICIAYTAFFVVISFLFDRLGRGMVLGFIYGFVVLVHFMAMGTLMAVNHFKSLNDKRNGYMASFGFIWLLFLVVEMTEFYF